jgi:hypothetical protein
MYLNFCNCSAETTGIDSGAERSQLPFLFQYLHSQTLRQNHTVLPQGCTVRPRKGAEQYSMGVFWVFNLLGRAHSGRSAADCHVRSRSARHRTWQAENPDFLLCRTRRTSARHCSAPSGLPTNCDAPFSTLPESLTRVSQFTFVLICLPSIAMGTKGFWWELDGSKTNLMRIV